MNDTQHVPVMAAEVVQLLRPSIGGRYIDATAGGGGHSEALLNALALDVHDVSNPSLLCLDADPKAVERVRARLARFAGQFVALRSNFRHLSAVAAAQRFSSIDGIVFDLGLSSDQLHDDERGFSLSGSGLDMLFDPNESPSAADLVNELDETALANLIYRFGEERKSRRIARAIVQARPIRTARQLSDVVAAAIGRREKIHPATRTFQALRIAANQELESLADVLPQAVTLLRSGGRIVVISFHSLEDRIVKQFFQTEERDCICPPETPVCRCNHTATLRVLTRKPLRPTAHEVEVNPRSRSARMRAAERL
jgi:16S rRNA (cytosine1402-N4)-methyltransferase